jgi:dTDP-4-dehydrorhamnose reductase
LHEKAAMMKQHYTYNNPEIWGGIECSLNRVKDRFMDQLELSGHYEREDDISRFANLGIKAMRYPVLWEKHKPGADTIIDWQYTARRLDELRSYGISPIAGLVHHGSGPAYSSFYDGSFEDGLEAYALQVARQFPWVEYYTPVNEPLTTARFCGLYGHWYPHGTNDNSFLRILLSECKATVQAMKAIRTINPNAKLVQSEDLGKTHSTPKLKYQANFENKRRWLSFDLLCGKVDEKHPLYKYILRCGIDEDQLSFFVENPCPPDILGINHYVTSERYIDENKRNYPRHTWGGNGRHSYADVEVVRVSCAEAAGPYILFKEAYERYELPIAVTEVHLHCTREEQLRWFHSIWEAAKKLNEEGVKIKAITAWALLGSFDWNSLLTKQAGVYEPGLYDVRNSSPRATALTRMVKALAETGEFNHPVLEEQGWWKRHCRIQYFSSNDEVRTPNRAPKGKNPIILIGKTGTLARAFIRIANLRGINCISFGRQDCNIADAREMEKLIETYKPWSVINTAGFVRVDEAESNAENCFLVNTLAAQNIANVCNKYGIRFVTFSSDLVFDGKKNDPYLESDKVSPLSVYGQSKAKAEQMVMSSDPSALIIRTSAFFGPWDPYNFVSNALHSFKNNIPFRVANDVIISPTYVPDLVNTTLDLLLDEENGIWNLSNKGELSWAMLASEVAERGGFKSPSMKPIPLSEMGWVAPRPHYSVLKTEKGLELPSLDSALERFFKEQELLTI